MICPHLAALPLPLAIASPMDPTTPFLPTNLFLIQHKYSSLVKLVEIFLPTTEITSKSENENAFIYLMVRAIDFL